MNEAALRAVVRETLARLDSSGISSNAPQAPDPGTLLHPSHYQYALQPPDGPCVIEPGVQCNHCGYCQSHGH
jgi:hypothetical protein